MNMDNLPRDYRDYPSAYSGQPKRNVSDDYSTWHDLNNPDIAPGRQNAEDALDPDKPAGMGSSPAPVGQKPHVIPKKRVIRWKRAK